MDSTVHRRASGTPPRNRLIPSAAGSPSAAYLSAAGSPSAAYLSAPSKFMSRPAQEVPRSPAPPERSGPHPRPGCMPRPP